MDVVPSISNTPRSLIMSDEHDGIIDSEKSYTTKALARIVGVKQARTVENKLRERSVEMDFWGNGIVFVSGKTVQMAIERNSKCDE
jgi:hypothetical protein